LTRHQERQICRLICRAIPGVGGLPYALWSRAAVAVLVKQRRGVSLVVRSMGRYLERWGVTPQKPLRWTYEQNPQGPTMGVKAVSGHCRQGTSSQGQGLLAWHALDESGVRSDDMRGRSHAPCGQTPEIRPCQKRASVGVIFAVANQGRCDGWS
jgi:hypothetical protein